MPRKTDIIPIADAFFKKSAKLLPCQKERIVALYNQQFSLVQLAAMFKVNRRAIDFIVHPENLEQNIMKRNERGGSKAYYDKEKHRSAIQLTRLYKKELFTHLNKKR